MVTDGKSIVFVGRMFNYSQVTSIRGKQNTDLQRIIIIFTPQTAPGKPVEITYQVNVCLI